MSVLPSGIAISAPRLRAERAPSLRSTSHREDARAPEVRAEQFAYRYGRTYDSYLVADPCWEHFWSAGRRGMIAVARRGRHQFCGGGLLAPAEHRAELLRQFIAHSSELRRTVTFLNIREAELPLFRDLGFQATKWGEEAIVDLTQCTWGGKNFAWLRRQANYCVRHGLDFFECRREEYTASQWSALAVELEQVSKSFLAGKPQTHELGFLQAAFDPWRQGRQRLFIARHRPGGRIEGFVACNPCDDGRTWVMETCRQRPDGVRGTVAFIMYQAMQKFQDEGVQHASLCLLPGLRCDTPMPGDSAMVRWGLSLGTGRLNPAYATAGAYHFKSRFRPRFENRYLCALPRVTLPCAVAFIRLVGALDFNPRKLIGLAWNRWQKRAARASLTVPDDSE
jgi:phosphatidylglycerol lysyltransferase